MDKQQKIQILDNLVDRAGKATYHSRDEMVRCIDDVKAFIRNVVSKDSEWIARIDNIRWSLGLFSAGTPQSEFVDAWNSGKKNFLGVLDSIKSEVELYGNTQKNDKLITKSDKVFIVHGHNETMKLAVASIITKLSLTPIILHEQPNKGRTIIEKFERLSEDVSFAIVLLSADDAMGDGKYRARQNVILELGYFIAKLGRENVIALYDTSASDIEIPSDISGILYEPYDTPNGAWRFEVIQELKAVGFDVDANALT